MLWCRVRQPWLTRLNARAAASLSVLTLGDSYATRHPLARGSSWPNTAQQVGGLAANLDILFHKSRVSTFAMWLGRAAMQAIEAIARREAAAGAM